MTTRRLFLSMVSDEFRDYRLLLTKDLERSRVEVTTQEKFGNLGATTLEKLDDYIKRCDAVIHLAGDGLGHVPPKPAVDALLDRHPTLLPTLTQSTGLTRAELDQCSYTQWEAYLALFHKVRIHIYRPDPKAPREAGFVADPAEQKLQAAHFDRIRKLGRDRDVFLNQERLSSFVLADLNDILPGRESTVAVSASRLPQATTQLIGRETELAQLDQAWNDPHTHLVVIRGKGGEGKTSLVAAWMTELAQKNWRGAQRVLDWSFYSQRTRGESSATTDFFFYQLLTELGDPNPTLGSAEDRAQRLAQRLNAERTLLVLDGLETLQYPPGPSQGRLKDNGMATLLSTLVVRTQGLVIITTRGDRPPEIEAHYGRTAIDHDLQFLSSMAGAQVLHYAGARRAGHAPIQPDDPELQAASQEVRGHALTLFLIGNYLRLIDDSGLGGDIRQRQVIRLADADYEVQNDPERPYGHAFKAMEAYARWFAQGDESARLQLSVLRMLGLFDRPASAACLKALRDPPIEGLSDLWHGKSDRQWTITLNRLREIKLIEPGSDDYVDAHPLIREYFAGQLRDQEPEVYQAAHARLFEYLCESTEYQPDTLDALQPLYQAVVHGCLARRQQEACDEVYVNRILRGTGSGGYYSTFKLGAIGADLVAVAAFFETPWNCVSPNLTEPARAWLLHEAALHLRALGRITEALEPMRVALEMALGVQDWREAARRATSLSELRLTLGELEPAVAYAIRAAAFAIRIDPPDLFMNLLCQTAVADVLHQQGRTKDVRNLLTVEHGEAAGAKAVSKALEHFEQAEALQREAQPDFELLYSYRGFQYCDLILAPAERSAWQRSIPSPQKESNPTAQTPQTNSKVVSGSVPSARHSFPPKERAEIIALADAERRATQTLPWSIQFSGDLLDIALDHLTLARVALYRAQLDPQARAEFSPQPARTALEALRKANTLDHLPKALLTATASHHLVGEFATARALLAEAQQIAERGPMPLYLADVHLHRARLVGSMNAADRQEHWPGVDPKAELAKARALIEKHHYGRRFDELADAEAASIYWS